MAPQYTGYGSNGWERTFHTTLADHIRENEQAWMKNFQMMALLEANGRLEYNCFGNGFDWPVEYKRHAVEGNDGETPRNFVRLNRHKTAALDYRGYQAVDAFTVREDLANRGMAAIIPIASKMVSSLEASIKQGLGTEPYIDGNAAGNLKSWHGLESMFGTNGTINSTTGAQRAYDAADFVYSQSDTYAGLSTVLGTYGGENDSGVAWPDGVCDPEFDCWSSVIVNARCSGFPATTKTFAANGVEALRYMIINGQRNSSTDGQMTNIMLNKNLYYQLLNQLDDKERIMVTASNGLKSLGFKNVVEVDGVECSWELAVPAATGYGFNYNNITLKCMYAQLFKAEGPVYDINDQMHKAVVSTLSNLKFSSPRNFSKLLDTGA